MLPCPGLSQTVHLSLLNGSHVHEDESESREVRGREGWIEGTIGDALTVECVSGFAERGACRRQAIHDMVSDHYW